MDSFNGNDFTPQANQVAPVEQKQELSRLEHANANRSIRGMKQACNDLRSINYNRFINADPNDRNTLFEIHQEGLKISQMEHGLNECQMMLKNTPVNAPRNTTPAEQKEIRGVLDSGICSEDDATEDYKLSQSGINKIRHKSDPLS